MADNNDVQQGAVPSAPATDTPAAAASTVTTAIAAEQKAIADAGLEAQRKQLDESDFPAGFNSDGTPRAGGRYLVNGKYVTADGIAHKNQKEAS